MRKITHAVIPVAGFGTRMLPLSKSVPKELLPLGNRPAIHYVVEEAIAAGIKHIVLVSHSQKGAIENYFDINIEIDNQLREKGKDEVADSLNWLPSDVTVSMIRQGRALGLGHAVLAAKPIIGNDDFVVLLPDVVLDPFTTNMSTDNLAFMIDEFTKDGHSQILVDTVADKDVHKYGIAKLRDSIEIDCEASSRNSNASFKVAGFVEKPSLAEAPSRLAVVGRYVFSNKIFDYLSSTTASVGGEIQLTDAIDALISEYGVSVTTMRGSSYDAGDMRSYMHAFIYFAQQQLIEGK
ncbi:UTP--glucose-1-phosphate uridylyltransferase [Psychrobacter sp. NZS113]|jgi:UTP--glucose-1-phosphate uridylyltransferase|uniref:UTP--glucose-1-phosphate uridylyltransferase n=1 Tax=Psychrobacter sp. NZS113 TaxID=2792045 RepID=UPI0018CC9D1F|nr:UTP--glucose-1-phosphate uridylyltransferase [Psychrobacter sp. NZS113]MBH0094995.1 UTP--glucose-1-phosphate uridylyltransferase [Psychrobacter sp. NZS113]